MPDKKQYLVVEITGTGQEAIIVELPFDEEDKEQYSVEVLTEDEAQARAGSAGIEQAEFKRS